MLEKPMNLKLLSGGAANGLVSALTPAFTAKTGLGIAGDFGAVGSMRERFESGEAADMLILTRAIIDQLAAEGLVVKRSVTDLGRVVTGIARRSGNRVVDVCSPDTLKTALTGADAIYFPDPQKATAGIHFAKVIDRLGITETVKRRFRLYPNGQTAMAAMAAGDDLNPIGCTQITEILNTEGVDYVGDLPAELGLITIYTAAVSTSAEHADAARRLIALLSAAGASELRQAIGFRR